ncbi:MAG TPA: acetyltransferase [Aliidongia sp.]|nr:acetyltransferase [Aliidongia sp.]
MVDNLPDAPLSAFGPVISPVDLTQAELRLPVLIPQITPGHRYALEAEARALGFARFPPLVDPTAVVGRTARLGEGTIVNGQAMIGAQSVLGRFVHVNRSASIGHDAEIRDYVTLGPGCVLAGQVVVETGTFIGAGAVVAPHVRIGANAVISAGAVVMRDVPDGAIMVGNPAKLARVERTGYGEAVVPLPDAD